MKKEKKDSAKKIGKMSALKKLQSMMSEKMGEGMKKVSVVAKDKEGLKKGLNMAEKIMGKKGSC